jgi:hypothetical protein
MDSILSQWDELIIRLREEEARLNAEVRSYPTPIARCDAQLPGLLDQRRQVAEALRLALEMRGAVEKIETALQETASETAKA